MKKHIAILLAAGTLAGCNSMPTEVFTGGSVDRPSDRCGQIGCASGGLVHYPHEENAAVVYPQRWGNWDWGKSYTAHPPGSPEYNRLFKERCDLMRSQGRDCMGRDLYN